ncbi:MAG TPA: hypothetical protein VJG32_02610 [Anaerolineae bacterium]|nr:hypothetical protein [Anaerolineae bacterium]
MRLFGNLLENRRRRYRVLLSILSLTGLCYCAGIAALLVAPSNRVALITATPTATLAPTAATPAPGVTLSPSPTQFVPPTFTPSPTATETSTPTPTATDTLSPTPTLTATPTDMPTAEPVTYNLLLAKRNDDGLFVVNQSASTFPIRRLRLGDGNGAINGEEWGSDALNSGECVTAWQSSSNPRPPEGIECRQVGERVTRSGQNRFWRSDFNIYYAGNPVGVCDRNRCPIEITVNP